MDIENYLICAADDRGILLETWRASAAGDSLNEELLWMADELLDRLAVGKDVPEFDGNSETKPRVGKCPRCFTEVPFLGNGQPKYHRPFLWDWTSKWCLPEVVGVPPDTITS